MPGKEPPDLPVIDVTALLSGQDGEVLDGVAAAVRAACLGTGFFYIRGHGVPDEVMAGLFEANRRFHALPEAEKLKIKLNRWHRGYEPFATAKMKASARFAPAKTANQAESFFLRHEVSSDDAGYGEKSLMGPNQWPDDPVFRIAVDAANTALRELGSALLPVFSVAVGEQPEFFGQIFGQPSTALRVIHYPPSPEDIPEGQYGIHPHTDYGFLTILAQDDIGGLEVRHVDGSWIEAPHIPGTFLVNAGDILARWTNDVFNSTPHRVINKSPSVGRYSTGMFFDPNIETVIRCLDRFVDEARPAKYEPVRYGDYFQGRLDSNYPDRVGL